MKLFSILPSRKTEFCLPEGEREESPSSIARFSHTTLKIEEEEEEKQEEHNNNNNNKSWRRLFCWFMVFFVVVGEWQRERDREMKTGQEWVSDEHLQIWTTWVLVAALLFFVGFGFCVLVIRTVRRRRRSWPPAMISSSSSSEKQALHASACRYVLFSTIEVVLGIL